MSIFQRITSSLFSSSGNNTTPPLSIPALNTTIPPEGRVEQLEEAYSKIQEVLNKLLAIPIVKESLEADIPEIDKIVAKAKVCPTTWFAQVKECCSTNNVELFHRLVDDKYISNLSHGTDDLELIEYKHNVLLHETVMHNNLDLCEKLLKIDIKYYYTEWINNIEMPEYYGLQNIIDCGINNYNRFMTLMTSLPVPHPREQEFKDMFARYRYYSEPVDVDTYLRYKMNSVVSTRRDTKYLKYTALQGIMANRLTPDIPNSNIDYRVNQLINIFDKLRYPLTEAEIVQIKDYMREGIRLGRQEKLRGCCGDLHYVNTELEPLQNTPPMSMESLQNELNRGSF
jgi:hypothetical protein